MDNALDLPAERGRTSNGGTKPDGQPSPEHYGRIGAQVGSVMRSSDPMGCENGHHSWCDQRSAAARLRARRTGKLPEGGEGRFTRWHKPHVF